MKNKKEHILTDEYNTRWHYFNGRLHRENGPAVEHVDGSSSWFINGERHRLDGPAVEWVSKKEWWIDGNRFDCRTQEEFERLIKLKAFW